MKDDHSHDGPDMRRLGWAALLTGSFMAVEAIGGWLTGSLALLADAGHMLTDTAALGMAWGAVWIAQRPADPQRTYGYDRLQVLAAFVNGLALIVITVWIAVEAFRRVLTPIDILPLPMLAIAFSGLAVNTLVFAILHGADRANLNVQGALLHVLSDLLGSVAAICAAVVIFTTGWTPIDPLLSILIAMLILRSGWFLVRRSVHILLEGTPEELDTKEIARAIEREFPEVEDVHHVHAWSLNHKRPVLTLHARVRNDQDRDQLLPRILAFLRSRFGIDHATVQVEGERCAEQRAQPERPQ